MHPPPPPLWHLAGQEHEEAERVEVEVKEEDVAWEEAATASH